MFLTRELKLFLLASSFGEAISDAVACFELGFNEPSDGSFGILTLPVTDTRRGLGSTESLDSSKSSVFVLKSIDSVCSLSMALALGVLPPDVDALDNSRTSFCRSELVMYSQANFSDGIISRYKVHDTRTATVLSLASDTTPVPSPNS